MFSEELVAAAQRIFRRDGRESHLANPLQLPIVIGHRLIAKS
jgi:hypothetical protein